MSVVTDFASGSTSGVEIRPVSKLKNSYFGDPVLCSGKLGPSRNFKGTFWSVTYYHYLVYVLLKVYRNTKYRVFRE